MKREAWGRVGVGERGKVENVAGGWSEVVKSWTEAGSGIMGFAWSYGLGHLKFCGRQVRKAWI